MNAAAIQSGYEKLRQSVLRFGHARRRWARLTAAAQFVLWGPGAVLAWGAVDWAFAPPVAVSLALFALAVACAVWSLFRHVLPALLLGVEAQHEAVEIESRHRGLDNRVIGALQLGREVLDRKDAGSLGYSPDFVGELMRQAQAKLQDQDPVTLIDRRASQRWLMAAVAVAFIYIAIAAAAPAAISARVQRLADAYAGFMDALFPVTLVVQPGDAAIVRGTPVSLSVEARGARRRVIDLIRIDTKSSAESRHTMELTNGRARFDVASANESFDYRFEYGGRGSPTHTIRVGDRPTVSTVHSELTFPAYTGLPTRTIVGRVPRLQALSATRAQVSLAATTELHPDLSFVEWRDGSMQPLTISGRFASFSFTIDRDDRATVRLTGALGRGFEASEPMSFEVSVERDLPPVVDVPLKNRNLTMLAPEASAYAVNFTAEDDFGVSEVTLDYRVEGLDPLLGRPLRTGSLPRLVEPARDRVKGQFAEVFKSLAPPLEAGDKVTFTLTAKDNNTETGPGVGRCAPVTIVVVRPDLAGFVEQQFGFGAEQMIGGLRKIKRSTNLLADAERSVRAQPPQPVERQDVRARVRQDPFPGGSEDAVGDYFRLLSGER